jgi:hypothetical protein
MEEKGKKYYANRGVERNKKPLSNIIYEIKIIKNFANIKNGIDLEEYAKYKFKDLGYLVLSWGYEKRFKNIGLSWHGFITPEELKEKIGEKQWPKFCQGKRRFIIQRRIDGKNIKKSK